MDWIDSVKSRWSTMSKQYADESEKDYLPLSLMVYSLASWKSSDRVLDAGCGPGLTSQTLVSCFMKPQSVLYWVDVAEKMLETLELRFQINDFGKNPDNYFKRITLTDVESPEKINQLEEESKINESEGKGVVYINEGAAKVLCSTEKVSSLLPVGVTKIEGTFKKGDIIKIVDEAANLIGIGVAQYGVDRAQEYLGKNGKKALVHYDYLLIEA